MDHLIESTQTLHPKHFMQYVANILTCCLLLMWQGGATLGDDQPAGDQPASDQPASDQPASDQRASDQRACRHQPILVRSRPVIERLPLNVIDPADVTVTDFGATLVAERQAGIVFLLTEDGETTTLMEGQKGLSRVVNSKQTGIHVLCLRSSSSTIYRITDNGFVSEFAELPFRATGLAASESGMIWTCHAKTGEILAIDPEGHRKIVQTVTERIVDIVADNQGAYLLADSGQITSLGSDGSSLAIGFVSANASRIQLDSDHKVIALTESATGQARLLEPKPDAGNGKQVGKVPSGTQAFTYDPLGNVILANRNLRALTKVTSHFQVPCPHCGKPVKMTLSRDVPAAATKRRSF